MKSAIAWLLFVCAAVPVSAASHPNALFYMTDAPNAVRSFLAHQDKIGTLVPTWYKVDANGLVSGAPNPLVLKTAQAHSLPVAPIVTASGKDALHALLAKPSAQEAMIQFLLQQAKEYGYQGIQFDFEDISWTDRDALSALVKRTAAVFHPAGLKLMIATVPNAPGHPGAGGFADWIYADWRGAYDLKTLAQSVDLICLMTYDQHTRWTSPGPVAGWDWTIENLKYALQYVPREKLSLGIPLYGYHWYSGTPRFEDGHPHPNSTADSISAPDALLLAREYSVIPQWDPVDHTAWYYFYRSQMREWVFFTDPRTFEDRYKLAEQYGLEGFCSWVLGQEDPGIWAVLPNRK